MKVWHKLYKDKRRNQSEKWWSLRVLRRTNAPFAENKISIFIVLGNNPDSDFTFFRTKAYVFVAVVILLACLFFKYKQWNKSGKRAILSIVKHVFKMDFLTAEPTRRQELRTTLNEGAHNRGFNPRVPSSPHTNHLLQTNKKTQ